MEVSSLEKMARPREPKLHPAHPEHIEFEDRTIQAIDVSEDSDQNPDDEGEYTKATSFKEGLPLNFTLCMAYMTEEWKTTSAGANLFNLLRDDGKVWLRIHREPDVNFTTHWFTRGYGSIRRDWLGPSSLWFPGQWCHICLSIDSEGYFNLMADGKVVFERYHLRDSVPLWRPENFSVVLGFQGRKNDPVEYTGIVTNLNVFSSSLSFERMERLTRGEECGAPGDFFSWQEAQWGLHSSAKLVNLTNSGVCRNRSTIHVYTATFHRQPDCMHHCQKIGSGRSPPVRTLEEWQHLEKELLNLEEYLGKLPTLWMAATDEEVETQWLDFYTGELVSNYTPPWYGRGGDAASGSESNCLRWWNRPQGDSWLESKCSGYTSACACQYRSPPILSLRGLCHTTFSQTLLDNVYTPLHLAQDPNSLLMMGLYTTRITYSDQTEQWILESRVSGVRASCNSSFGSYVLGKHTWTIENEPNACNGGQPYTTQLKLTGCSDGQFTCDDGQCVRMEERCDQVPNCRDKSDEIFCQLLMVETSYNKKVPPITAEKRTVPVKISIVLMKIVSMEEVRHSISFKFEITLEWREARALYYNLKDKMQMNALTDQEIGVLWLPYVIYDNTDMNEAVQLQEGVKTAVVVQKMGDFIRSELTDVDETEIFIGDENSLTMYQTYTKQFQCQYYLHKYPFDTQVTIIQSNYLSIIPGLFDRDDGG